MWGMGMRPGDMICVAAIFSLYMGAGVRWQVPSGSAQKYSRSAPGARHVNSLCAMASHDEADGLLRHSDLCAPPCPTAQSEGLNPREFGLKYMFFSGEPGASIPGVRNRIEDLFGAKVFDAGSMAEMSPWMNVAGSAQTEGMLCWQDIVYTEVCDPKSMHRVAYGQRGTPVYTHLERTRNP